MGGQLMCIHPPPRDLGKLSGPQSKKLHSTFGFIAEMLNCVRMHSFPSMFEACNNCREGNLMEWWN